MDLLFLFILSVIFVPWIPTLILVWRDELKNKKEREARAVREAKEEEEEARAWEKTSAAVQAARSMPLSVALAHGTDMSAAERELVARSIRDTIVSDYVASIDDVFRQKSLQRDLRAKHARERMQWIHDLTAISVRE